MTFSDRIKELGVDVNDETVTELREFLVTASEQIGADPALMAMSMKTLEQELSGQGYDYLNIINTLQILAKATSASEIQAQLMAAWQTCKESGGSVSDFAVVLTRDFPEVKGTLKELVAEAHEEHRSLSGIAGGSAVCRAIASPFKRTPNATKKQKWEKRGMAAAELAMAAAVTKGVSALGQELIANYYVNLTKDDLKDIYSQAKGTKYHDHDQIMLPKELRSLNQRELAKVSDQISKAYIEQKPLNVNKIAEFIHSTSGPPYFFDEGRISWSDLSPQQRLSFEKQAKAEIKNTVYDLVKEEYNEPLKPGKSSKELSDIVKHDSELYLRLARKYPHPHYSELHSSDSDLEDDLEAELKYVQPAKPTRNKDRPELAEMISDANPRRVLRNRGSDIANARDNREYSSDKNHDSEPLEEVEDEMEISYPLANGGARDSFLEMELAGDKSILSNAFQNEANAIMQDAKDAFEGLESDIDDEIIVMDEDVSDLD